MTTTEGAGLRSGALFLVLALLIGADLAQDSVSASQPAHLWLEALAGSLAAGAFAVSWWAWAKDKGRLRLAEQERELARAESKGSKQEAERWRREAEVHIQGLVAAIEAQLRRWSLSPGELEVAWLLLKGLSLPEIAKLRGVSGRTIQSQARGIYAKAGLKGRAELSAFFLEDWLDPGPHS